MFRQVRSILPPDPQYPHDLVKLGYFINNDGYIKSIENPKQDFNFFINRNERYNLMQREAMNSCIRNIVIDRLTALHVPIVRLPIGATTSQRHVPVFVSEALSTKKRVIVVFNESVQDLGIWAYRDIGNDGRGGIDRGSAVDFVKKVQSQPSDSTNNDAPGIIIANLGQLLWWRKGKQPVSFTTWDALPRKSAVHGPYRIDDVKNRVPENEDWEKHTAYVFEQVVGKLAAKDAKIDLIGLSDGGGEVVKYLNTHWSRWSSRIDAIAFGNPLHAKHEMTNPDFVKFLSERGRAYLCCPEPAGTPQPDFSEDFGCPAIASGESEYSECVMAAAYPMMCDFFQEVAMGRVQTR
ncbi:MAG: hypothetical protein M1837_007234 [Sclerophora amabilis]|nr:MAG: hypothetical protein M1837_007234 [Sclerophora amabilis]